MFSILWIISFLLITNYSLKIVCSWAPLWKAVEKLRIPRGATVALTVISVAALNHFVIYSALSAIESTQSRKSAQENVGSQ